MLERTAMGPTAKHRRRILSVVIAGCLVLVATIATVATRTPDSSPAQEGASDTPTTSAVSSDGVLTWAPPPLTDPTTIRLDGTDGAVDLDPDRDYILRMPTSPLTVEGGLRIVGGRNVVLIGGEVRAPSAQDAPDPRARRGLLLKNQTGTAHIEGLRLSGEDLSEGINLDQAYGATVQLQNISVATVHGTREGNHADILQTWAGPSVLRVDGLQGSTEYQGLFLLPQQFVDEPPTLFDLRRVLLISAGPNNTAGYLLWTHDDSPWLSTQDVLLVDERTDIERMVEPSYQWQSGVSLQRTADGAKLPAGDPGLGYATPGYWEGRS